MTTPPSMSCPSGGTFYACGEGSRFVGCCTANPCGSNGCSAGNLKATSMEASQYGQVPDQDCDSSDAPFFTCNTTTPTFWGCCKSNPCDLGSCPGASLVGAKLWDGEKALPYLEAYNGSFVGGSGSAVSVAGSGQTQSSTSTPMAMMSPAAPQSKSTIIGAIAGGAVGGFAVLAALIFGIVFLFRRKRSTKAGPRGNIEDQNSADPSQPQTGEMKQAHTQGTFSEVTPSFTPVSPYPGSSSPHSASPYPGSPQPPSYWDEQRMKHVSYELPGSMGGQELESGQMYHPYRQKFWRGEGPEEG